MPTVSSYGTAFIGGTGWTTPSNIVATPGSFASLTTTTAGASTITVTTYGFASTLPVGAQINNIVISIPQYVSGSGAASRWNAPSVQPYLGTTPISTSTTLSGPTTTTTNVDTVTLTNVTFAQLTGDFRVQFTANKSGTQTATQLVDYLLVTVDYSFEQWGALPL